MKKTRTVLYKAKFLEVVKKSEFRPVCPVHAMAIECTPVLYSRATRHSVPYRGKVNERKHPVLRMATKKNFQQKMRDAT